jgi:hypothetical protein
MGKASQCRVVFQRTVYHYRKAGASFALFATAIAVLRQQRDSMLRPQQKLTLGGIALQKRLNRRLWGLSGKTCTVLASHPSTYHPDSAIRPAIRGAKPLRKQEPFAPLFDLNHKDRIARAGTRPR